MTRLFTFLFQDTSGGSYSQAPQKPVRRKYHAENQNPEAIPPPAVTFPPPAKPAQKSVKLYIKPKIQVFLPAFELQKLH